MKGSKVVLFVFFGEIWAKILRTTKNLSAPTHTHYQGKNDLPSTQYCASQLLKHLCQSRSKPVVSNKSQSTANGNHLLLTPKISFAIFRA